MQKVFLLFLGLAALIMAVSCVIILYPHYQLPRSINTHANMFTMNWNDISVTIPQLTASSTVETAKNTPTELTLVVRPQMHNSNLAITITVSQVGGDESFPKKCLTPLIKKGITFPPLYTGWYKITTAASIPTHYTGPYSNPNPYTPDVIDNIEITLGSIRIGYCS